MFLEVALPLPVHQTFTYRCRPIDFEQVELGQRILVPFQNRKLTAYVINKFLQPPSNFPPGVSLKEILGVLDKATLISPELFKLSQWISDYYFAPLGEVLKACLPPKINVQSHKRVAITSPGLEAWLIQEQTQALSHNERKILQVLADRKSLEAHQLQRRLGRRIDADLRKLVSRNWIQIDQVLNEKVLSDKHQFAVSLDADYREAMEQTGLTPLQNSVVQYLQKCPGRTLVTELQNEVIISPETLRSMERKGILHLWKEKVQRDPFKQVAQFTRIDHHAQTEEQVQALMGLGRALQTPDFVPVLLHGVTGSGKTEIYLRLIEGTLRNKRDCLVLMPEIGLTPRIAQEFRSRLGQYVAILHSALGDGERFDEWWRIKRGEAKVVIGTRSAVLAPLRDLKLIIVDEEHDPSYKQQESPRYHARDTALLRGKMANALVILGSATPALESYYNAQSGKYKYIRLASRVHSRPLPAVRLVDMRRDFEEAEKRSILSKALVEAMRERLDRKEQVLILLNRRGFSASVLCRCCGQSIQCKNCSISLAYHRVQNTLLCHYCAYEQRVTKNCPSCGSEHLYFLGEGTEKIETLLKKAFPHNRISRFDRDSVQKKNARAKILQQFQNREIDILVGTQMISKGHDFPNVTLVGILSADTSLSFPDFRCAERTFHLLSQMSGRAGRGNLPGEVIIQTYYPEHYCLKFVTVHDYQGFYEKEIRFRKFMHYPPFTSLALIQVRDKDPITASRITNAFGNLLTQCADNQIRILGPTPAPLAKIKSEHRFQIILKSKSRSRLNEVIKECLSQAVIQELELRKIHVDIDPTNMM
jgi:primosomal protein N' (replication factor Y) (superfamily II helicase)